jgi:hypothetical protein
LYRYARPRPRALLKRPSLREGLLLRMPERIDQPVLAEAAA